MYALLDARPCCTQHDFKTVCCTIVACMQPGMAQAGAKLSGLLRLELHCLRVCQGYSSQAARACKVHDVISVAQELVSSLLAVLAGVVCTRGSKPPGLLSPNPPTSKLSFLLYCSGAGAGPAGRFCASFHH